MKTLFTKKTLASLTLAFAVSPVMAESPAPAPCSNLPAAFEIESLSYTSPQMNGDYQVTLSFPALKTSLCRTFSNSKTQHFHFDFTGAAVLPRISVRDPQGRETQTRSFTSVRVVHQPGGELSLLKAVTQMSDLDILTYFPKEGVLKENLERGGSEAGRTVSIR